MTAKTKTVTSSGEVFWYGEELMLEVDRLTREGIEALAFVIEGYIKANILANDQVDTGFMLNTVYAVTPSGSGYTAAWQSGQYTDKAGGAVPRQIAPEAALPPEYDALVAVGADYALFQEFQKPFIFPAFLRAAAEAEGVLKTKAKNG